MFVFSTGKQKGNAAGAGTVGARHIACFETEATVMHERDSMDWVRRASDYRILTGKRDQLGADLDFAEAARLAELEAFFTETIHPARAVYTQRDQARIPISVVVSFSSGRNVMVAGRARDISGEGIYVETAAPLAVGTRTVVAVTDRTTDEEWRFSAEVVRLERDGMGLRLVGIPLSLRVGHRTDYTRPLRKNPIRRAA
jgi:hypothetical protein